LGLRRPSHSGVLAFKRRDVVPSGLASSEDAHEGARAFAERRAPVWHGRWRLPRTRVARPLTTAAHRRSEHACTLPGFYFALANAMLSSRTVPGFTGTFAGVFRSSRANETLSAHTLRSSCLMNSTVSCSPAQRR